LVGPVPPRSQPGRRRAVADPGGPAGGVRPARGEICGGLPASTSAIGGVPLHPV